MYHNLGICHLDLSDHIKAVAYFEAQDAMAIDLKLGHVRAHAALGMGVALSLQFRAEIQAQLNLRAQKQQLESSKRELEAQLNEQMRAGQAELDAMVSLQVCMYLCGWARVWVWVGE